MILIQGYTSVLHGIMSMSHVCVFCISLFSFLLKVC